MGAALGQRQDMVDFLGRGNLTGPLALLAQWVGCDIAVTNPLPCAAIPALAGRIALVLIVMRRDDFLVFLTIAPGGQTRAAGLGTGALGFVWHKLPPPVTIYLSLDIWQPAIGMGHLVA